MGEFASGVRKLILKLTRSIYNPKEETNSKIILEDDAIGNDYCLQTLYLCIIQIVGVVGHEFCPEKFSAYVYEFILSE